MSDNGLMEWIVQNAGPAIKLRVYSKQSDNDSKRIKDDAVSKLISLEKVNTALSYLDAFRTDLRDKKTLEHLIHYYGDICIDQFFPEISDLGFRAGIKVFDDKMQAVANIFTGLLSVDTDYGYIYSCMLHRFFFLSGYITEEINNSMLKRLNALHMAAKERSYNIYQEGKDLPKPPKLWENHGIIKEELNPFSSEADKPLPTIYDLSALAYFQNYYQASDVIDKIEDVASYILETEFQKFPEYYGLLWNKSKRIYNACGWCPRLPKYNENSILNYLHMMSNFNSALKSEWFKDGLNYLEQFRTEKGTYLFPQEFLLRKYLCPSATSDYLGININCHEAYLNKENMKLNRNERAILIRELVSSLNLIEIKSRVNKITEDYHG